VINKNGLLTSMNPEAERLLGWKEAELLNKNIHDVIHCKKADGTLLSSKECPVHDLIKNGGRYSSEDEMFTRKDGGIFSASVVASPILEGENILGAVIAFRDITERKKLQDEFLRLQQLESIGILAGGIAHDFNNLLQAIMGNISFAKMLLPPQDKVSSILDEAEKAAYRARELSYRLITFSKGGSPVKTTVSIAKVINQAVKFSLRGRKCKLELSIPDQLLLVADENQMLQVFNDMLTNACEAMPEGGLLRISVKDAIVSEQDNLPLPAGKYLKISIQDTGCGIPEKQLARIFDPYFTTKEMGSSKGMGLGLSICHSIIIKHGGHITVESKVGEGTTFHIYLPTS